MSLQYEGVYCVGEPLDRFPYPPAIRIPTDVTKRGNNLAIFSEKKHLAFRGNERKPAFCEILVANSDLVTAVVVNWQ